MPAISSVINTNRPNQMRSKPRASARGKKMGTVMSIMEVASMNIPSTMRIRNMTASTTRRDTSKLVAHSSMPAVAPE